MEIRPGWSRSVNGKLLGINTSVSAVNNTGNIFIENGRFSPEGTSTNYAGQIIGRVVPVKNENGELSLNWDASSIVPLGNLRMLGSDRVDAANRTIEIRSGNVDEEVSLTVIERRVDTSKEDDYSSAFRYKLTDEGISLINDNICGNASWIKDTRISKAGVTVYYYRNGARGDSSSEEKPVIDSFFISSRCFVDNYGCTLLSNGEQKMTDLTHIFQSEVYTEETELFRPMLDKFENIWALYVHKTNQYSIPSPKGFMIPSGSIIFPTTAGAAVKIGDSWYPLNVKEPLRGIENITEYSKVVGSRINSAISPQNKLFDLGQFGGSYRRDDYFYGLLRGMMAEMMLRASYDHAMNRAKYVRGERGIQSGRNHLLHWEMLFNELIGDLQDTNSLFYKKLVNFSKAFWQSGVSEDTQLELVNWLTGLKMLVTSKVTDLETQESSVKAFIKQNAYRYILSEELFDPVSRLVLMDLLHQIVGDDAEVFSNWHEVSEVIAGRTWYKMPFAKSAEFAAIPMFLASNGTILFFPVDFSYFTASWLFKTVASLNNYKLQMNSLGYSLWAGFWGNQVDEDIQLKDYWKTASDMYIYRNQYGNFMQTRSAADKDVPFANIALLLGIGGTIATSLAYSAYQIYRGGYDQVYPPQAQAFGTYANWVFGTLLAFRTLWAAGKGMILNTSTPKQYYALHESAFAPLEQGKEETDEQFAKRQSEYDNFKQDNSNFLETNNAHIGAYLEICRAISRSNPASDSGSGTSYSRTDVGGFHVLNNSGFEQLLNYRSQLMNALKGLKCTTKDGRIWLNNKEAQFMIGTKIADLAATIEMAICTKANRLLRDSNSEEEINSAIKALQDLGMVSHEFQVVMETASAMRRYGISLPGKGK